MSESDYSKEVNDKRVKNFIEEFKTLLSKYRVEIELEEDSSFYNYGGSTYHINICFDGYSDGDEYVQYRDLNIGRGTILSSDGSVTI